MNAKGAWRAVHAPGKRQVRVRGMDRGRIVINETLDDPLPEVEEYT